MPEFYVGESVRVCAGAEVSDLARRAPFLEVEGYEEIDGEDFVIVRVPAGHGHVSFTQLVLPEEIESAEGKQ